MRIYLSSLMKDGEWSHAIYRDIQNLRDAWKKLQEEGKCYCHIVHVGHDRPNYDIALSSLSLEVEQPVLMSDSAKWSLPALYAQCSLQPVAQCTLPNREDRCSLYLALNEWGYEVKSSNPFPRPVSPFALKINAEHCSDWVAALCKENPSEADILLHHGIGSEETYHRLGKAIEEEDRDRIDNFRFDYYRHQFAENDPFAILAKAPAWLLSCEMSRLHLTVRLNNIFKNENILVVKDLLSYTASQLLKLPNFGRKSLSDLSKAILQFYDDHKGFSNPFGDGALEIVLSQHLQDTFNKLPEQPKAIIFARLGYGGNRPLTLEELGQIYGVTRERIRQIEKKYLIGIIDKCHWDDVLVEKLESLLKNRNEPLYLDLIEIEDPWFSGFSNQLEYLAEVIEYFAHEKFFIIEIYGRKIVSRLNRNQFEALETALRREIESQLPSRPNKNLVRERLSTICLGYGAHELKDLLWQTQSEDLHFITQDNEELLVRKGRSVEQLVMVALEAAKKPLHYSDLHKWVLETANRPVDIRRVHGALTSNPDAKLFNRGTYGLKRHLSYSSEQISSILMDVEAIITEGSLHKQWHLTELLEMLSDEGDVSDNLSSYELGIILQESDHLISLGKQIWVSKHQESLSSADRILEADAFYAVLKKEGGPLTTQQLLEKAATYRGMKPTAQVQPNRRMFKVTQNLWGIAERDVALSEKQRQQIFEAVHAHLMRTKTSLHISEMATVFGENAIKLPSDIDHYLFLGLCNTDERFRTWPGQLIGLSIWETAGRENFSSACRQVFEQLKTPASIEAIHMKIEKILGRSVERRKVSNALSAGGFVFDRDVNGWSNLSAEIDEAA